MATKQIDTYTVYLNKVLGRGSFGNVYKAFDEESQHDVAIKILPKDRIDRDPYLKISLINEIKIMQAVKSEHIVRFLDVMETSKNYYIVSQLCDGDLTHIIKRGELLPEEYCIEILTQICEGFLALVREGVIHRDLKPANILRKANTFKIADFGFSKQMEVSSSPNEKQRKKDEIQMFSAVGTPLYMPIEILKSENYTSKCDIWALGFIFYELLHGDTPWSAGREFQLVQNIELIPLCIRRTDLSPTTVDFLTKCLQKKEKDRISWNQIFVHPIFKGRFLNRADENKEFENKMKSIMTKLRFYFHLNRQSLQVYLTKYGYKGYDEELSFENYFEFLKVANPKITQAEALYIFKKTDLDGNGAISLEEILTMLNRYGIAVQDPRQLLNNTQQTLNSIEDTPEFEKKLTKFFNRLHKIIHRYKITLKRIFGDFDKNRKGYLAYSDFKALLQKFLPELTDEDVLLSFRLMDNEKQERISLEVVEKFYSQYNQSSN